MGKKSPDEKEVVLSVELFKIMKDEAESLANRAAFMLIDEENIPPAVERASNTLISMFMSFRSLVMFIEEAEKLGRPDVSSAGKDVLIVPTPLFLQIADASAIGMKCFDEIRDVHRLNLTIH